jgi:pimeloyl-ACP methyl ester carboxylesterase
MLATVLVVAWATQASAAPFSCRASSNASETITTITTTLAGIPAIVRVPKTITKPPIVLWHGFGPPANEQALMDALPLDDVPAIKVYLGLPLFGQRLEGGNTDALVRRQKADFATQVFEPVVVGAAHELADVVDALRADGCMRRNDRIGLFGFSGGGAAVLLALAEHRVHVGSAVVLNASTGLDASIAAYEKATGKPYTWNEAARALARRTNAVARAADIATGHPPVALLIVQGTADATLAPQSAIDLDAALRPHYASRDVQRLHLELSEGLSHNVTDAAGIGDLRRRIGDWFNRFAAG